ncbi:MAG: preprotein translocase subunit SecE [Deltaproteobacteria bacterium HGW-Deltaproteobacteria-19]|jgi:preprotein translocase subunit SecE|nr:MAG: preprotein translocase subunit SecE [Deltaproteobacteria bacterium HGW-Deltaproteobacteria-19]
MDKVKEAFEKVKVFLAEAKAEFKKVTWPTPKQALASTSVVLVVVVVMSLFLGLVDFGLVKILRLILG